MSKLNKWSQVNNNIILNLNLNLQESTILNKNGYKIDINKFSFLNHETKHTFLHKIKKYNLIHISQESKPTETNVELLEWLAANHDLIIVNHSNIT
jgi:hypothetical protein